MPLHPRLKRVDIPAIHERNRRLRPVPPGGEPGAGTAMATGIAQGMASTLPIVGGAAGAILTGGNPLGVGLGIAAGEAARRVWQATFDVPTVDELPQALRPFGVAGELLGGSVAPAMGPFAAGTARSGVRFIDRVLDSAQRFPRAYVASETATAVGAAAGAGMASELYKGDPRAELVGGMVGATTPGGLTLGATSLVSEGIQRARQALSVAGRQNRAAAELQLLLGETGEDPKAVAAALREFQARYPQSPATAAQATGSPGLALMEAELGRRNAKFSREAARRGQEALETTRGMLAALTATGDPAALREAATLRQRYFDTLLSERLAAAERELADVAAKITTDTPAARAELSRRARELLSEALSEARRIERELWSKVPGHIIVERKALLAEANRIKTEELLPNQQLPLERAQLSFLQSHRLPNLRQLIIFRSQMLDDARKASAAGDVRTARIYGKLAEAALKDMEAIGTGEGFQLVTGLDDARSYSRTLNDVFTRSFAGDTLASIKTGAERIPPEVLMRRATAGPAELVDMRLQELERAVRMGSPEAANEMLQIQERVLRLAITDPATGIVDPRTGLASAPRLDRFIRGNEAILQRFPEIKEILHSVESANQYLKAVQTSNRRAGQQIAREAAFARVAGMENPIEAVGRVLRGTAPERQFGQLARLAQTQGPEATEGLRAAVLQYAFERAGGNTNEFSFTAFRNALMTPPRPGQKTTLQLMRDTGVLDADTASRLSRLLDEADRVETALRARPQLETMLADENLLLDLVLRMTGSRIASLASSATGNAGGHSIIIAGAGSRFARDVMNRVPAGRVQDVLIEAAQNPSLMVTLLEKPRSPQRKFELARKANAWLVAIGLANPEGAIGVGESAHESISENMDISRMQQR